MKRAICIGLVAILSVLPSRAEDLRLRTVAIDAGHGGDDPGAVSKDRRTYEKTITLDIARRLVSKINEAYPDVKVISTRPSDAYVTLNDRAEKANRADADLFISIHVNSTESTSPNGYSIHILGQSKKHDLLAYNMEVCRRENSVILLEDDYSTKYQGFDPTDPESYIFMQLMQNAYLEQSMNLAQIIADKFSTGPITKSRGIWQDPLYLLWKTSMPAVLVEVGFISNTSDLDKLKLPENREAIAVKLLEAFSDYKKSYDSSMSLGRDDSAAVSAAEPSAPQPVPAVASELSAPQHVPAVASEPSAPQPVPAVTAESDKPAQAAARTEASGPVAKEKYGIQIFAGSTLINPSDKRFLGYQPVVVTAGKFLKYVIAVSDDPDEVRSKLEEIRKSYPEAFPVKISDKATIPLK